MLSTSREHLQWTVELAGRRFVVDVAWPGFANQIAVDGQVVQRWRWPGNNLRTSRSFVLDGVGCTLTRQRTGLFDFAFELRVGAADAVVRQVVPPGAPLALAPAPGRLPLAVAAVVLAVALVVLAGVALAVASASP